MPETPTVAVGSSSVNERNSEMTSCLWHLLLGMNPNMLLAWHLEASDMGLVASTPTHGATTGTQPCMTYYRTRSPIDVSWSGMMSPQRLRRKQHGTSRSSSIRCGGAFNIDIDSVTPTTQGTICKRRLARTCLMAVLGCPANKCLAELRHTLTSRSSRDLPSIIQAIEEYCD